MAYTQKITPNPHIPCQPGWCLMYVRQAFGLPAIHPTATAAWEASTTKHRDRNFPQGVWHAVWYGLKNEPAGHVVLRAPDGSVYSTSSLKNTPYHHPDLADLERYYARYGMTLTYRGWTEDVQGIPVISYSGLSAQGTIKSEDEELSAADVDAIVRETNKQAEETRRQVKEALRLAVGAIAENDQKIEDVTREFLKDRIAETSPKDLAVQINAAGIAAEVQAELINLIGGK